MDHLHFLLFFFSFVEDFEAPILVLRPLFVSFAFLHEIITEMRVILVFNVLVIFGVNRTNYGVNLTLSYEIALN